MLIIAAIALAVIGVWAGWGWVVALGIAPLILAMVPCLIMCALGLCMMGKGKSGQGNGSSPAAGQGMGPGTVRDPVTLGVLLDSAVASAVYQGRTYYFESRENRDAFESDPTKYVSETPAIDQAVGQESVSIVRS
ncbi:MAG: YHS domain-containing protein [Rhodospirillales bacterium]|nr:YHS domain-containing protein [Rhodospirillales bacterium]